MITRTTDRRRGLHQGDIIAEVKHICNFKISNEGEIYFDEINYPWIIIVSQECDLLQDLKQRKTNSIDQDKLLPSCLVAPLYNFEQFKEGSHLSEIDESKMHIFKSEKTKINDIKKNNNPRYHYLNLDEKYKMPSLIVDFKHYFTQGIEYLLEQKKLSYVTSLSQLFREDLSHRFAFYISRIGLPV